MSSPGAAPRRPSAPARGWDRPDAISSTSWKRAPEHLTADMHDEVVLEAGWGRLVFGQTFADHERLRDVLRKETTGRRDICLYLHDPHVLVATFPQEFFIDPSYTYRIWTHDYRPQSDFPNGVSIHQLRSREEAVAMNRVYVRCGMVPADVDVLWDNQRTTRHVTYLVAIDEDTGDVIGTVTGVDHARLFADPDNAFEAFVNGQADVYPVYRAAIWTERTKGTAFDKNWIVKRRIRNHHPIGFQGFAMNMRRPPFDDLRVRQALAYLLNREKMVETLMHNQYFLHKSYFEDLYSASNACHNPVFDYKPDKARELLTEAGWIPDPRTGIRMRDGKPLSFTFLTRDESTDKFLVLYNEDLKRAGVEMKIVRKDWAAWTRDMDEFNFDMTWAAWSSGLFKDPESMWSSAEADRKGGNNITGFKDPMVDQLIETQRGIFDLQTRHGICRRIDFILAEQVPYILLWNLDTVRLLYWDKFGTPPTVLSKYGDERSLLSYWWYDADSAAELEAAMETGEMLPPRPDIVDFDETFRAP